MFSLHSEGGDPTEHFFSTLILSMIFMASLLSAPISKSATSRVVSFSLSQDNLLLGDTILKADPGEGML